MSTRVRSHPRFMTKKRRKNHWRVSKGVACNEGFGGHLAGIFKVNTVTEQTWEHFNTVTELIVLKN